MYMVNIELLPPKFRVLKNMNNLIMRYSRNKIISL